MFTKHPYFLKLTRQIQLLRNKMRLKQHKYAANWIDICLIFRVNYSPT